MSDDEVREENYSDDEMGNKEDLNKEEKEENNSKNNQKVILKNRICYKYDESDKKFIRLTDCQDLDKTTHEDYEDIDLYDLYQELMQSVETFSKKVSKPHEEEIKESYTEDKVKIKSDKIGNIDKSIPLNLLIKGVPGTGKSRFINDIIIGKKLNLSEHPQNILRINVHSALTNAELMQGVGISTKDGNIIYSEKEGLVLNHIKKAILHPYQPFVLILEEVQENSLNELIGDLIYLIEEDKRVDMQKVIEKAGDELLEKEFSDITELVKFLIDNKLIERKQYIEIPYLVENKTEYKPLIFPANLYIFCTSNYRDDKKIMEDNLLRRFEVIELYPDENVVPESVRSFFKELNQAILEVLKDELHPDRYLIGHATFLNVNDEKSFAKALLKVIIEFKDIREVEFETVKRILNNINSFPPFFDGEAIKGLESYKDLIEFLQQKAYGDLISLVSNPQNQENTS